jgi:uncharacterized protein (DUF433 family)
MSTILETTLVRTPGVCGGRLRIDGTRMTVGHIVALYRQGLSAEQIVEQHPQRTIREISLYLPGTTNTAKFLTPKWRPKTRAMKPPRKPARTHEPGSALC